MREAVTPLVLGFILPDPTWSGPQSCLSYVWSPCPCAPRPWVIGARGVLIHHYSPGRLTRMPQANESPRWDSDMGWDVGGVRWLEMSVGVMVGGDQTVTVRDSILAETGARGRCVGS